MKPTSRSRKIGRIGFCTASRRLSAATSTSDSIQVGSCHATTSPAPTPNWASPAAARSASDQYSAKVRVRMSSSTAISASGVASTRFSMSSQSVLPCSMPAPFGTSSGRAVRTGPDGASA